MILTSTTRQTRWKQSDKLSPQTPNDPGQVHMTQISKRLFAASAIAVFCLTMFAVEPASAARPSCNATRIGRTYGSGATRQTCTRARTSGRTEFRWVVRVPPTAPARSSGSAACLEGGIWEAPNGVAYWQNYFERKTSSEAGQVLKVVSGRKVVYFGSGRATIIGEFVLTSVPFENDPGGPIISGIGRWDFEGAYHVSPGGLVADTRDIDAFEIKMSMNGSPIGAIPRPAGAAGFTPGETIPFTCARDRLTIVEQGASGNVTVEYRRVST